MKLQILIIALLFFSCKADTSKWHQLDFGVFTLNAPGNWEKFKEKGIDSYVGGLTNGKDSLWFDYGWYSPEVGDENPGDHLFCQDTINGLFAIIQIPKINGKGSICLSIPKVNEKGKFYLGGSNINGTDSVLKIFKSLIFKTSDTAKNSVLTKTKFKAYPNGFGKTILINNCSSCHMLYKKTVGPAFNVVMSRRDEEWISNFILNRKSILKDSLIEADIKATSNITCPEFTELDKEDIQLLISYLKQH